MKAYQKYNEFNDHWNWFWEHPLQLKDQIYIFQVKYWIKEELQSFGHMFKIMIISSIKDLTLTKIIKGLIKLKKIFRDKCFNIDFKLILLSFRDEFKTLIISLDMRIRILFEGRVYK